ncbi:MAG: hypothetical protein K6E60_00965 [Saccharofermentans sp.]|nr:hypothetical protein [Saccharofermentans sp.]
MVSEEQFIKDLKELLSTDKDIDMNTDLLEIDEWDSLSSAAFLVMINENYGIYAEPFSVAEAIFVEDLYHIVK